MNFIVCLVIGAVLGVLGAAGIFFAPVYLAKGGPKSGDAPYVIPSSIITEALPGLFIVLWGFKA